MLRVVSLKKVFQNNSIDYILTTINSFYCFLGGYKMNSKIIPVLLIVVGLAALGLGLPDFGGDVGIPMTFIGIIGILSGIGFWRIQ